MGVVHSLITVLDVEKYMYNIPYHIESEYQYVQDFPSKSVCLLANGESGYVFLLVACLLTTCMCFLLPIQTLNVLPAFRMRASICLLTRSVHVLLAYKMRACQFAYKIRVCVCLLTRCVHVLPCLQDACICLLAYKMHVCVCLRYKLAGVTCSLLSKT